MTVRDVRFLICAAELSFGQELCDLRTEYLLVTLVVG